MTYVKFNNRPISKTIDSVFDDLLTSLPASWTENFNNAPANIHETKDGFHVELSVPGLAKEDFKINIEKGLLTVSYEKKEENKSEDYKTIRREFSYRSFKRSFNLDENVNVDQVQAKYENGILKLYLPKKEAEQPSSKQVTIQ